MQVLREVQHLQPSKGGDDMLRALQAVLAHGYNQQQAMQRAVQAKAQGLDPTQYGSVLPGSTITTNTTNNTDNGTGIVKGSLLTAALLAAGGGGAYLLSTPVVPKQDPPARIEKADPVVITKDAAYDAVYEVKQPDGTWKQVKRERLKPGEVK